MYKITSIMTMLAYFLSSCCTVASSQTRQITVTAEQNNAEVTVDGYACGKTPLMVDLDKRYDHTILVSSPGYQSEEAYVNSYRTGRSAWNILTPVAGAAIGTGIGLAYYGTATYAIPFCAIGTVIGLAAGLGLGVAGAVADSSLRSDCDLNMKNVHFNLNK